MKFKIALSLVVVAFLSVMYITSSDKKDDALCKTVKESVKNSDIAMDGDAAITIFYACGGSNSSGRMAPTTLPSYAR